MYPPLFIDPEADDGLVTVSTPQNGNRRLKMKLLLLSRSRIARTVVMSYNGDAYRMVMVDGDLNSLEEQIDR